MLDAADIQSVVLRSGARHHARHLVWSVRDAARARAWLRGLVGGTPPARLTSAADWPPGETTLNLGLSRAGLAALQVLPPDRLERAFRSFPAFLEGAVSRAARIGDTGAHAPAHWHGGLDRAERVHCVLSLYAATPDAREQAAPSSAPPVATARSRSCPASMRTRCRTGSCTSAIATASRSRR
jgi:hypothetical protein